MSAFYSFCIHHAVMLGSVCEMILEVNHIGDSQQRSSSGVSRIT